MPDTAINLRNKLACFSDHWAPRVIAELNDYQFKLVKVQGAFVWHAHDSTGLCAAACRCRPGVVHA